MLIYTHKCRIIKNNMEIEMENETNEMQPMLKQVFCNNNNINQNLKLKTAILQNDEKSIKDIITTYPETSEGIEDLRCYIHTHKIKENIFNNIVIIACVDENVKSNTLATLCEQLSLKYGSFECVDTTWYGWEPIHYVAKCADVLKLEVLLKILPDDGINALTYFSENALHVLLQYEKSVTPYGVVLHNGSESRQTVITGTERKEIVKCAKQLIEQGIDVNQTNFWNETPMCLAVRYRFTELIKLFLTVGYIDLDSFKECGKTIREYLKWNMYTTLTQSYVQEDPVRIRFNFLKSGDEDNFIKYNKETLSDHVDSLDGGYGSSSSMLQLCLRKGFLEYLKDENYKIRRMANYDIKESPMLNIFKAKGFGKCIIHLLDNGADTSIRTKKFKDSLLDYAAARGYYPFVAILLQHKKSKINIDEIFSALSKLCENTIALANHDFYRNCVIYLLLNRALFLSRQNREYLTSKKKHILNKLLCQLNLENDDRYNDHSEIIYQILHLGGNLTYRASNTKKMIVERLHSTLLRNHFDDCIRGTTFRYDSIIQDDDNNFNENATLDYLVNDYNKQILLAHPLLVELTKRKWAKIYMAFYADLLFYAFLLFSIYGFVITQHFNYYVQSLYIIYRLLIGFQILKEGTQLFFLYRWKYFLESSNIIETITIITCLITIYMPNIYTSVISILFSTFTFFVLLGQLPFFTKYTIIFSSISYFFQYMAFYFIQFVSFALCFYLIFPFEGSSTEPDWAAIMENLFLTLVYFTGEFGDRVIQPTQYPVFGRIFMTVFIFCMTIILNNLIVGLIVADMDDIQQGGRLYKQIKLNNFMQCTNKFMKRLHEYKSFDSIKKVIHYVNVFKKDKEKTFKNVNIDKCDEENKRYLKQIKKNQIFNRHMLKDVYSQIFSNRE